MTRYVLVLCTFFFALRTLAQALQIGSPVTWLPQADAFQGSELPYPLLLGAQVAILALMLRVCLRVLRGGFIARVREGRVLFVSGAIYMIAMLGRLGIGLTVPAAASWFRAWIPTAFHLVLATFILTLAHLHLRPRANSQ